MRRPTRPATPMTSARLQTRPSLTPKITARSVPDRPGPVPASRRRVGDLVRGSRPVPSVRPDRLPQPAPDLGVLALVGGDRLDLGRRLAVVDLLLVALERGDEVADRAASRRARATRMMNADPQPRAGSARAGRRRPSSRSLPAQISAWRRSLRRSGGRPRPGAGPSRSRRGRRRGRSRRARACRLSRLWAVIGGHARMRTPRR